MKKLLFAILFFLLALPSVSYAAAVGVYPEAYSLRQDADETLIVDLVVYNTGDTAAIYTVAADEYQHLFRFDTPKFRLEPGMSRQIFLSAGAFPPGTYATDLSVIAQEVENKDAAKTGVKIPVDVTVLAVKHSIFQAESLVLALIFLAAFLLIGSFWVQKRLSPAARLLDTAEETILSHTSFSWFKHYRKRHLLVLLSFVAITLALFLLILSYVVPYSASLIEQSEEEMFTRVQVEVRTPGQTYVSRVESEQSLNAFTALQQAADESGLSLSYDPPNEYGVFVKEVAGYENGQEGKYWVFERNGKDVPVAADKQALSNGDLLLWKFVVPDTSS